MVPIAKGAILLVLLGGATVSTYAVANGGFGNKAKSSEEEKKENVSESKGQNTEGASGEPGAQKPVDGSSHVGTTDSTTISTGTQGVNGAGTGTQSADSQSPQTGDGNSQAGQ